MDYVCDVFFYLVFQTVRKLQRSHPVEALNRLLDGRTCECTRLRLEICSKKYHFNLRARYRGTRYFDSIRSVPTNVFE